MRYSLKTFLLTITLLGTGCGLAVHLKNHHPVEVIFWLQRLMLVGPLIAAVLLLLWIALRGSAQRSGRLVVMTALIGLFPLGVSGILWCIGGNPYRIVATNSLILAPYASQWGNYKIWEELLQRLMTGDITAEQATMALEELAIGLAGRNRNPSSVQFVRYTASGYTNSSEFLKLAWERQLIAPDQFWKVLEAYHDKPKLTPWPDLRDPLKERWDILVEYADANEIGFAMKWTIDEIKRNGKSLQLECDGACSNAQIELDVTKSELPEIQVMISCSLCAVPGQCGFTRAASRLWKPDLPQKTYKLCLKNPEDCGLFAP